MKKRFSLLAVPILVAAGAISAAEMGLPPYAKETCTFPAGYTIGAKTPVQLKKYTGVYVGKYDGGLLHSLIVTDIGSDGRADLYTAVDNFERWRIRRGCRPISGMRFQNGVLSGTVPGSGTSYEYVYKGNQLRFTRRSSRFVSSGTLTKVPAR